MLDNWDGLLRATGGALEKAKSYWYLLDYTRQKKKWGYKTMRATPADLLLLNYSTNIREPIDRFSPHKAMKVLGIFTSPSGSMSEEVKYLLKKAKTWADSLRCKRIRKEDTWYCLNSNIMKSIEYPLVAMSFTKKQCSKIMAPILTTSLHSVHVQKKLRRVLVYSPLRYQGLGIADPWATQIIEHLHCILCHCT
jgi:hypothetical protein